MMLLFCCVCECAVCDAAKRVCLAPPPTERVCLAPIPLVTTDPPTLLPDILLSRWWKRVDRTNHHHITSSTNPRTLLHHIAR